MLSGNSDSRLWVYACVCVGVWVCVGVGGAVIVYEYVSLYLGVRAYKQLYLTYKSKHIPCVTTYRAW